MQVIKRMADQSKQELLQKNEILPLLGACFKYCVLGVLPWFFGYFQMSFAWIVLLLFIGAFFQSGHVLSLKRKKVHKVIDEEDDVKDIWPAMPSWIYFSEEEHALWVNKILDQIWPYVNDMVEEILKKNVEPAIQSCLPGPLQCLCFDKISLGQTPAYITNIRTYHTGKATRDDEFILDLDIVYNGDANFVLGIKKVKLGVSDFEIHGPLRVIFKPLVTDFNPVGGVSVFFLNRPKISFELTNLLSVLDIPGIKDLLLGIVQDVFASFIVLPNRISVPLALNVDVGDLQYPIPDGVLRVEVVEAKELIKADTSFIGEGSSDPYCILEIGAQKFRTKTRNNNCNPVWKETFEAFIDNTEGQQLFVKVYDEDVASKDEEIGHVDCKVSQAIQKGTSDVWLALQGVKEGSIHMKLSWFSLTVNPDDIRQATPVNPTVASLFVKVITAIDLPSDLKDEANPKSIFCNVRIGKVTQDTYSVYSTSPTWNQRMRFLISNPRTETIRISLMEGDKILCHVAFDIKRIENVPGMAHEGAFPLIGPGFEKSALKCKVELRALKAPDISSSDDKTKVLHSGNMKQSNLGSSLPARLDATTPHPSDDELDGLAYRNVISNVSMAGSSASEISISPGSSSEIKGEVQLALRYDHTKNVFLVVIIRANNLKSRHGQNKTNPYAKLYLLPKNSKSAGQKTSVVRASLSPEFNETFRFDVDLDELKDKELSLAVKNARGGLRVRRGRNVIGRTTIPLSELPLSSGVTMTYELYK